MHDMNQVSDENIYEMLWNTYFAARILTWQEI